MEKRKLYALGEPLGDSVTRREFGRVVCGGGSSSKSSSNATTHTTNTDRRQVVAEGAVGISTDGSSVTVNNENLSADVALAALDAVKSSDATNGTGFAQLLSLADKMFTGAGEIIGNAQDTTLAQVAALNTAANDQKGQVDQKTLIILAVAGVGMYAMSRRK